MRICIKIHGSDEKTAIVNMIEKNLTYRPLCSTCNIYFPMLQPLPILLTCILCLLELVESNMIYEVKKQKNIKVNTVVIYEYLALLMLSQ